MSDFGGYGQNPDPDPAMGGELPGGYADDYQTSAGGYTGPTAGPPPGALAGFWIRFAGALLDAILLGIVGSVLFVWADGAGETILRNLMMGAYFTYLHSTKAGQSLGQRVCGIRVVDAGTGGQVDPAAAGVRWLMSYVSGFALLIGYLWMLWDPQKQTWHDKVANTLVVYSRVVPPPTDSLTDR